jgi:hypothetical protein
MAWLQITLKIPEANRAAAARVYREYKEPFLNTIVGAKSKDLLIREEDVQVLHGFDSIKNAKGYLTSELFAHDIVGKLRPLLAAEPDVRVYQVA